MKSFLFTILIFFFLTSDSLGNDKLCIVKGIFKSDEDSAALVIKLASMYLNGDRSEFSNFNMCASNQCTFQQKVPLNGQVAYVKLVDVYSMNSWGGDGLFSRVENLFVEPGDELKLSVAIHNNVLSVAVICDQKNKFELFNHLSRVENYPSMAAESIDSYKKTVDSLLGEKIKLINRYKGVMSRVAFDLFTADAISEYLFVRLAFISYLKCNKNTLWQSAYKEFLPIFKSMTLEQDKFVNSYYYIRLIDALCQFKVKDERAIPYSFPNIMNEIDSLKLGINKERMVLYYYSWNFLPFAFGSIDKDYFANKLLEEYRSAKLPIVKERMKKIIDTRIYNAEALNFQLARDSSQKLFRMSDLKGKVVLVDLWGYVCGACVKFSKVFHEKIYPKLKDNKDFVVVSVMLDDNSGYDKYLKRLRNESGQHYTYPEYINLYGGIGAKDLPKIVEHYNVSARPYLYLIGKNGKIYSACMPNIIENDKTNIKEFERVLLEALKE